MRLWSIHPCYLDAKGLVALWREGLLGQAVLLGNTRGYKNHPQLTRFKNTNNPVGAIARYLWYVAGEADRRGYSFDRSKIAVEEYHGKIPVTSGQIEYEFRHLLLKLKKRSPERHAKLARVNAIRPHPIMKQVRGDVEKWEKRP